MFELILLWKSAFQFGLLLLTVAAAWRWGAGPEKWCAGILLWMSLIDWPYHWIVGRTAIVASIDLGHFLIDLVASGAFLVVALKANRLYPLWIAAFQIVSLTTHLARDLTEKISGTVYGLLVAGPSYLELLALIVGIAMHHRRARIFGSYRSWRASSSRSPRDDRSTLQSG